VNSLIDPLVAVTLTTYDPGGTVAPTLIVRIEFLDAAAGRDKLAGESETVGS